jgi:hypothetical protein
MAGEQMNPITYADLSRLRLRDFVGKDVDLWTEESGMQIVIGLGGFERRGETSFGWRQGEAYHTAEVTVDLGSKSELPPDVAQRIIEKLRLPLRRGLQGQELIALFGKPQIDETHGKRRFLRFIIGDTDVYVLGCAVEDEVGLVYFFLARKDYCDEEESL